MRGKGDAKPVYLALQSHVSVGRSIRQPTSKEVYEYQTTTTKVLAFAGSTRSQSFNKKLACLGAEIARESGAESTFLDLCDYPLPLFDEDLEKSEGTPKHATALYRLFQSHDAILMASPEYNSSISGVLKNTIDWVSRPREGEPRICLLKNALVAFFNFAKLRASSSRLAKPWLKSHGFDVASMRRAARRVNQRAGMAAFSGKTAGLLSASPGQLGGLRGLSHLRSILGSIGMLVIPDQVAIGAAHEAFAEDGTLVDEKQSARLASMVRSLVVTTTRLKRD